MKNNNNYFKENKIPKIILEIGAFSDVYHIKN